MSIPITNGSGQSSVAAEAVGGLQYQQVEIYGKGGASVVTVNPDGSINASIIGTPVVSLSGNASVSGTVGASIIGAPPANLFVGGALVTTANPVPIQPPASGTLPVVVPGSVIAVLQSSSLIGIVTGSVVALPTGNQSVSGTIGSSVIGWVPTQPSNTSTIGVIQGSVGAVIIGGSIAASFTPPANQSVSGTVDVSQIGTWRTSVISSTPSSMLAGASIFGQLPAGTAVLGSVATLQGTTPWINTNVGSIITTNIGSVITVLQSSSIIAINAGSVIAVPSNYSVIGVFDKSPSIVGTYAEDAAFTQNDKGLFVLGVRNDNMASVSSADLDYSQFAVGPVGENIVANAPITKWVQGTADIRGAGTTGGSVTVIAAQGASVFTYVTSYQVANLGSASVLVTFSGATSSIIGYTIAPAGGGSNVILQNALKTNANGAFTASISGIASVLVSAQGFTARI